VEARTRDSGAGPWRLKTAALFLLLVMVVYADPLFTGRSFVGRDLVPYGYPLEKSVHEAWARGKLPVWNEDVSGGRPLFPNPNAGTLYPIRPLLSRLPFPVAMRLFPVLHWALAGIGMMFLLGVLGASGGAAWISAVTYVFSGVIVSQVFYVPNAAGACLLPWALWAVARPVGWRRKGISLGVVFGLLLLAGDAFSIGLALLGCLLWLVVECEESRRAPAGTAVGVGLFLGMLLAAPQIVATALLAPDTQRAVLGLKLSEALFFTLSPWRLLELAVPYPFGQLWTLEAGSVWGRTAFRCLFTTLYCGAFALVALAVRGRPRAAGERWGRALFAVGAVLAIAGNLVPAAWGSRRSPIPLRYPEKFSVAIVLGLALLSGLAFDRVRSRPLSRLPLLALASGLAVLASAAVLFPEAAGALATSAVGAPAALAREAGRELPSALAEAGLFWIATLVAVERLEKPGRARTAAALVLLTAVPILADRRIAPAENDESVFPPTAFSRAIAKKDPHGAYRTLDEASYLPPSVLEDAARRGDPYGTELSRSQWSFHTPALWNRGTVFNADPDHGDLARVDSLRTLSLVAARREGGEGALFSAASLRFGIRWRGEPALPGYRKFGGGALQAWDENPGALPAIRLLERWREEPGPLEALDALRGSSGGGVVLETGRHGGGTAAPGTVRVVAGGPERLRVDVTAPEPAWLFVLRGFWTYRTVLVDGRAVEPVPAQLAFSAVPVPAGTHRVDWREEVPGFEASRWGPAVFALLVGMLLLSDRSRSGRSPRCPLPPTGGEDG
jgi:hypothetical protein